MKIDIRKLLDCAMVALLALGGFSVPAVATPFPAAPTVEEIQALLENRMPEPEVNEAPAPEKQAARQAAKQEAKQEAVKLAALFDEMEAAATPQAYIRVLQRIYSLPDYRTYTSGNFVAPKEIPFDQLSGGQSATSLWWYDASGRVDIFQRPESVRFYNEVLFPRYQAFFRKLAKREYTSQVAMKIGQETGYRGRTITTLDICRAVNPILNRENIGDCIILMRTVETSYRDVKPGDSLKVDLSIFEIAPAYAQNIGNASGFTTRSSSNGDGAICAVLKVEDKQGKSIFRWGEKVDIDTFAHDNGSVYVMAGYGMGHVRTTGNTFLKITRHMGEFYISSAKPADGVTISAACMTEGELMGRKTERQIAASKTAGKPVGATQSQSSAGSKEEGMDVFEIVLGGILVIILFSAWGSLPYMIWVLMKEKRRCFEPVPLPEGSEATEVNFDNVEPACDELGKFLCDLQTRKVDGESIPVYTCRQEVDKAYEILARLKTKKDELNTDSLRFMNMCGVGVNEAQMRHFCGSKLGVVIAVVVFAIWGYQFFFLWESYLEGQLWIALAAIYFLSMRCPAYKMANPQPTYYRVCKSIVKVLGLGSLVAASGMAEGKYATVYQDRAGNLFHSSSEREAGCAMSLFLLILLFVFAPFIMMLNGLCDFIRNYIGSK